MSGTKRPFLPELRRKGFRRTVQLTGRRGICPRPRRPRSVRTAGFLRWEGECIFTSGHSGSSVGGSHQFGIQRISWSSQDRKALFPRIRPINLPHGWMLDHLIPRCFSTECNAMPAATLTFKEPILPAIGMLPRRSAWPSKAGEIPVSSAPNIRSSGPLRSIASN